MAYIRNRQDETALQADRHDERIEKELNILFSVVPPDSLILPMDYYRTPCLNISRSGMCMLLDSYMDDPQVVQMNLKFRSLHKSIPMMGEIVWCKWSAEHKRKKAGVRFVSRLPENLKEILAEQ